MSVLCLTGLSWWITDRKIALSLARFGPVADVRIAAVPSTGKSAGVAAIVFSGDDDSSTATVSAVVASTSEKDSVLLIEDEASVNAFARNPDAADALLATAAVDVAPKNVTGENGGRSINAMTAAPPAGLFSLPPGLAPPGMPPGFPAMPGMPPGMPSGMPMMPPGMMPFMFPPGAIPPAGAPSAPASGSQVQAVAAATSGSAKNVQGSATGDAKLRKAPPMGRQIAAAVPSGVGTRTHIAQVSASLEAKGGDIGSRHGPGANRNVSSRVAPQAERDGMARSSGPQIGWQTSGREPTKARDAMLASSREQDSLRDEAGRRGGSWRSEGRDGYTREHGKSSHGRYHSTRESPPQRQPRARSRSRSRSPPPRQILRPSARSGSRSPVRRVRSRSQSRSPWRRPRSWSRSRSRSQSRSRSRSRSPRRHDRARSRSRSRSRSASPRKRRRMDGAPAPENTARWQRGDARGGNSTNRSSFRDGPPGPVGSRPSRKRGGRKRRGGGADAGGAGGAGGGGGGGGDGGGLRHGGANSMRPRPRRR